MLRTTLPLPYPVKMFITGHGIFPEKIALLKQLSGSTDTLIMITLNHLVLQNETQKLVLTDKLCDQNQKFLHLMKRNDETLKCVQEMK